MGWFNKIFRSGDEVITTLNQDIHQSLGGTGWTIFNNLNTLPTMSLSSVFACVELISNSVAELPVNVNTEQEGKTTTLPTHAIYDMFNNSLLTKYMLIKMMITDMLLYGDGFAYIERDGAGTPKKLVYCPHGTVSIMYNDFDVKNYYYLVPQLKAGKIEPINMLHFIKNSKDGVHGIGVIQYAKDTLKLAGYTEDAAERYFSSGCHVSGILKTSDPRQKVTSEQSSEILSSWRMSQGKNGNGIAIVTGGLDYTPVSSNSKDAQLLESRLFNLQDICRFFNISPVMVGDLSHSSYSTIEATLLEFVTHTLSPYIIMCEEEMTRKLIKPSEKNLYINLDENFKLRSDKKSQAQYLTKLVSGGIISVNEARSILGFNKMDDADKLIIPYTNIDDNTINKPDNNNEKDGEGDS